MSITQKKYELVLSEIKGIFNYFETQEKLLFFIPVLVKIGNLSL